MLKFYYILFIEFVLSPFLYLREVLLRYINLTNHRNNICAPANSQKIIIGIHDWALYDLSRKKTINGKTFDCGLSKQIDRFSNYSGSKTLCLNITISDFTDNLSKKYEGLCFKPVDNLGMDFKGYSSVIRSYTANENPYVLLLNSSVEASQVDFLDSYVDFLEQNKEVGLLGISYSTKVYQTLIRNNFNPHIQSFFLMSTMQVMRDVIHFNKGIFPGENISHKRLLIRNGEVRLSKIVEKLGYKLAIVTETGKPCIFPKGEGLFNTAFRQWSQPYGEYRFHVSIPNKINPIKV